MQYVVTGGVKQFGPQRRDTGIEKEWRRMRNGSEVILLMQALFVNANIANKWLINTRLHSDLCLFSRRLYNFKSHIPYESHNYKVNLR
jgi:hypothetical protein